MTILTPSLRWSFTLLSHTDWFYFTPVVPARGPHGQGE